MDNIVDKIEKLYKLSQSPNENEAKAALKKAEALHRKYYREYQQEVKKRQEQEYVQIKTSITCTNQRSIWAIPLAEVIAENNFCCSYQSVFKGKRTYRIILYGERMSIQVAYQALLYATEFLHNYKSEIYGKSKKDEKDFLDFCFGFISSLKKENDETVEMEKSYGLPSIQIPKKVKERLLWIKKASEKNIEIHNETHFKEGERIGKEYNGQHKIE